MMGADTFEAREGWVPANTEGSVWCYRTRGSAGVIAFRRTDEGHCLYEATHQDCYASDETITTTRRVEAVRFAAAGAEAPAPPPAASDAPTEAHEAVEPPVAPSLSRSGERDALRAAWYQYIHATSELLKHVRANLADAAHGELLGWVDEAMALVREGAFETPASELDGVDRWSASIGAVLRQAYELIAAGEQATRSEIARRGTPR